MYIFKESGDIVQENETVSVKAGNVKINIDITSWSFCDGSSSCKQNEMGEYLDFDIVMKGKSGSATRADSESGNTYTLGDSGSTMLSRKIKVDGAADLVDMATDYPKLITQGSKQIFRFRFPKFTTSILYDPTIFLNPDGTNSAVKETISAFMLAAVGVLFYML
ncbi:skeletal aspartic acid-rich protein 2-like [Mercenaria mercenaria]|uniref:skeletal aspartic acid-rich protein 2-like n=1 Tax=Mercenaria mercenaria TaxID=6596 RepID=UPI00234F5D6F|nr:skeletal aspartic acid-rich protein 2-like [Mercenaria mercenaria]